MQLDSLPAYERSLRTAAPLHAVTSSGGTLRFDVRRWMRPVDAADRTVLRRCVGPVLDVGCGPGRFVHALALAGVAVLGLDIADTAVHLTRRRGGAAMRRSVFDRAPGEGRWQTVLLMDGNVGIGGYPDRILERAASLMAADGRVIVEVDPDPALQDVLRLRFVETPEGIDVFSGPEFEWGVIGAHALEMHAARHGLHLREAWSVRDRTFVQLESAP